MTIVEWKKFQGRGDSSVPPLLCGRASLGRNSFSTAVRRDNENDINEADSRGYLRLHGVEQLTTGFFCLVLSFFLLFSSFQYASGGFIFCAQSSFATF